MNNTKSKKIEILAPCGSYDILVAAVHAGANACYIGGNCFGARAYAENFDTETILKAVRYAHLHGVKVYLTVNTLLKNDELSLLYDSIKPFYEAGGDALIIQDLGVFLYVRQQFPDIALHCSTQMNLTSRYGAAMMKQQGASRIVTAREMSLEEIQDIKQHVDIEVESFVHGAMCYSYSGQCLMSSLAGGRSGNRGRCAQPCRKCYDNAYQLSMKDMCTLTDIPKLVESGIDSFKIEGRMKNAYYVASTVHAYRTLVDDYLNGTYSQKKAEQLTFELANIYNRGGFSNGYYFRHNGPEMLSLTRPNNQGVLIGKLDGIQNGTVSIRLTQDVYKQDVIELMTKNGEVIEITSSKDETAGSTLILNCPKTKFLQPSQKLYRTKCPAILKQVQNNYMDSYKKIPVFMHLKAHIKNPISLYASISLNGTTYSASISDCIVEESRSQTVSVDTIQKPFAQLGNTDYTLQKFVCEADETAFLPNGVLKNLRRRILEELETVIFNSGKRVAEEKMKLEPFYNHTTNPNAKDNQLTIRVSNHAQLTCVLKSCKLYSVPLDILILPPELYTESKHILPEATRIYIELPHVIHKNFIINLQDSGISGIYIKNIDGFAYVVQQALPADISILADSGLYCYNRLAHSFLKQIAPEQISFVLPRELNLKELHPLSEEALCCTLYEYQPVMITANCIQKTNHACKHTDSVIPITDEMGNQFFVKTDCKICYNTIYNKVPFSILDKYKEEAFSSLHKNGYLLHFTIESEKEVQTVMQAFSDDTYAIGAKTNGHLYRGVL